jgi:DNA-binding transcriptional LysR family regulator
MNAWEGIEEAVMVAQLGSFVRAAERLNTAPSNVSRAIDRLEQRLQTRLFTRTTRVVKLTDSGRIMVAQFARLVTERDEAFASWKAAATRTAICASPVPLPWVNALSPP